jgi:hypothetical protein
MVRRGWGSSVVSTDWTSYAPWKIRYAMINRTIIAGPNMLSIITSCRR